VAVVPVETAATAAAAAADSGGVALPVRGRVSADGPEDTPMSTPVGVGARGVAARTAAAAPLRSSYVDAVAYTGTTGCNGGGCNSMGMAVGKATGWRPGALA
jgi:hypothetical protein